MKIFKKIIEWIKADIFKSYKDADLDYIIVTDGCGITRAICRKKENL